MLILFTGGPCGGKSTLIRRIIKANPERFLALQESATSLLASGYPLAPLAQDSVREQWVWHFQEAVLAYQRAMERAAELYSDKPALCDRGSLDGASFVPSLARFCEYFDLDREQEYARYHCVIHLQSLATLGEAKYRFNNAQRFHTASEAVAQDARVAEIWSGHPRYHLLEASVSLAIKLRRAQKIIDEALLSQVGA